MIEKKPNSLSGQLSSGGMPVRNDIKKHEQAIDFNKIKSKLDSLKKKVVKKYPFIKSLSVLSMNASKMFEEEEGLPKEVVEGKPLHLMMVIPEEQYKNVQKIKPEVIKLIKETGENLWIHIHTPIDLWNYGSDSKFEFIDAVSGSFVLHDSGFLGSLRVANIHKSLVLRKFEKYVASYVIAGSLITGTAGKDSDVDTHVIIDDTDVKRMPRLELLEKLRGIIYDYIREASVLAGVKNILNVQVSLLTDFWQRVKDAEPVAFTFIRDGVPLYDRGTFTPWKLLLKMGKIKPSPEAIDLFMKQGEQTGDYVKRRLLDAMVDTYFGVVTPTQAMMMLAEEAPPTPKELVGEVKKVLVDREKVMSMKDLKILEKAVKLYKDYEHGKLKEFSGKELDIFVEEGKEYQKMLKELRKKIEARMQEKAAEEIYEEVFDLLKKNFGKLSQQKLVDTFEKDMVKKGKISGRFSKVLKDLVGAKRKLKMGKLNAKEVDKVKRNSREFIDALTEYGQRADLFSARKNAIEVFYENGKKKAELVLFGKENFIIDGKSIKKIKSGKLVDSNREEFEKVFNDEKGKVSSKVSGKVFDLLKKNFGEFEIVI
jgi:predicted nucleotidyltransferase